ncbi:MAG: hypothetical protein GTO12_00605 [Proteobacteria bacterium]|nr:hypothetical protein [Pseudomonadota bacterium]
MEGVNFSERINFFIQNAFAHYWLGETYFEIGEYQRSKDHYRNSIWFTEHGGFLPSWVYLIKTGLARAKVMNNEKDIDLEPLYGYLTENRIKAYDGQIRRYVGEILLNIDDQHMSEAGDWIKEAIETDEKNGMMWHLGSDYSLCAQMFKLKGDQTKARENLSKAIEIFKECGADGWLAQAEKELASLS